MKRVVEVQDDGGFESALGETISLWCGVYIYSGKLVGVNEDHVELDDAYIVYETGPLTDKHWKDAQLLPGRWRVMKGAIESWGVGK